MRGGDALDQRVDHDLVQLDLLGLSPSVGQQKLLALHALLPQQQQHPKDLYPVLLPLQLLLRLYLVGHQLPVHLLVGLLELLWDLRHDVAEQADAFSEGPRAEADPRRGLARRAVGFDQNLSPLFLLGRGEEVVVFGSDPLVVGLHQRHCVELGRLVIVVQLVETAAGLDQIQIQLRLALLLGLVLHVGLEVGHIFLKAVCFLLGAGGGGGRGVLVLLVGGRQRHGLDLRLLRLHELLPEGELSIHGLMRVG